MDVAGSARSGGQPPKEDDPSGVVFAEPGEEQTFKWARSFLAPSRSLQIIGHLPAQIQ
jgi:hypothetical protein